MQLSNLALMRGVRETTIGEFLRQHGNILRAALQADCLVFEPTLEWLEHDGSVSDKSIRPDVMFSRPDGYYDILDLKLALVDRRRITKGERRRRRFVDAVEEGIAQISNYEFYFSFPGNAKFAADRYGIRVQKPRMILVVGNKENTFPSEVEEALRRYGKDRFVLIDYDSLAGLFLKNSV